MFFLLLLFLSHRPKFRIKKAASLRTLTRAHLGPWIKESHKQITVTLSWEFYSSLEPKSMSLSRLEREIHSWIYFCCRNLSASRIWMAFWGVVYGGKGDEEEATLKCVTI